MTDASYYRGPSEPGGSDEIMAEVVDGILRRRIEWDGTAITCVGFEDYPIDVDMEAVSGYVWRIEPKDFEAAWKRYCSVD